jgi:hypothetical protein
VRDLYIPRIGLAILLQPDMWTDPGNLFIAHRHMNVRIGTEVKQFLSWEHINLIFVAVHALKSINSMISMHLKASYLIHLFAENN